MPVMLLAGFQLGREHGQRHPLASAGFGNPTPVRPPSHSHATWPVVVVDFDKGRRVDQQVCRLKLLVSSPPERP